MPEDRNESHVFRGNERMTLRERRSQGVDDQLKAIMIALAGEVTRKRDLDNLHLALVDNVLAWSGDLTQRDGSGRVLAALKRVAERFSIALWTDTHEPTFGKNTCALPRAVMMIMNLHGRVTQGFAEQHFSAPGGGQNVYINHSDSCDECIGNQLPETISEVFKTS